MVDLKSLAVQLEGLRKLQEFVKEEGAYLRKLESQLDEEASALKALMDTMEFRILEAHKRMQRVVEQDLAAYSASTDEPEPTGEKQKIIDVVVGILARDKRWMTVRELTTIALENGYQTKAKHPHRVFSSALSAEAKKPTAFVVHKYGRWGFPIWDKKKKQTEKPTRVRRRRRKVEGE